MATLSELQTYRAALEAARYSGNRRVKTGNSEIEFKSDNELSAALREVNRQINALSAATRPSVIYVNTSKGL